MLKPTRPRTRPIIDFGHIGLDVQEGRAIEDIDPRDPEEIPLPSDQLYGRDPNVIGPPGRSGGEDAVDALFQVGFHHHPGLPLPVEEVQDDEMREPFDILKPRLVLLEYLQSGQSLRPNGLERGLVHLLEGGMDDANGGDDHLPGIHDRRFQLGFAAKGDMSLVT